MLSHTGQYALRAVVYLATHEDEWPIAGARIARETRVPARYLSAILCDLVRVRLLEASPGPTGGYRMARPARQIRLMEVLAPLDGSVQGVTECPFGNDTCSDDAPCAGHSRWRLVKQAYLTFLEKTSVQEVSVRDGGAVKRRPRRRKEPQA